MYTSGAGALSEFYFYIGSYDLGGRVGGKDLSLACYSEVGIYTLQFLIPLNLSDQRQRRVLCM